jgi:Mor family transcriptional regulator
MTRASQKQDIKASTLSELTGMVQRLLGVDEREALRLASALYTDMRRQWYGRHMVFHQLTAAEQAPAIRAAWNGCNMAEVCERFGVSKSTVYMVIGRKI